MIKIKKAIFPVAGLGTRFLPATKAIPKEMLPIIDKPLIEYAVEEAVMSGIEEIIFITSHTKPSIKNHFEQNDELEEKLLSSGNDQAILKINRKLFQNIKFTYVEQKSQRGLGHAILLARDLIKKDESFAILLADDLVLNNPSATEQLIKIARENDSSVIGLSRVPKDKISNYGVISSPDTSLKKSLFKLEDIVEKPLQNPPSDLAVFGRYVLSDKIFHYLENLAPGAGDEIQLTDAIKLMLKDFPVHGYIYDGIKFDCGSKQGYVEAILHLAQNSITE